MQFLKHIVMLLNANEGLKPTHQVRACTSSPKTNEETTLQQINNNTISHFEF